MKQIDSVEIDAGECLLDWEFKTLINHIELLWGDFSGVVSAGVRQNFEQSLKVDEFLFTKDIERLIELKDLLLTAVELDNVIVQMGSHWDL